MDIDVPRHRWVGQFYLAIRLEPASRRPGRQCRYGSNVDVQARTIIQVWCSGSCTLPNRRRQTHQRHMNRSVPVAVVLYIRHWARALQTVRLTPTESSAVHDYTEYDRYQSEPTVPMS